MTVTAAEIMKLRTGITDDSIISTYIEMATNRVISFLGLDVSTDTTPYTTQIADIAVLLWQMDNATKNATVTLGYSSHSFSEGGVSESVSGVSGEYLWQSYTSAIDEVLQTLKGVRLGVVRFL